MSAAGARTSPTTRTTRPRHALLRTRLDVGSSTMTSPFEPALPDGRNPRAGARDPAVALIGNNVVVFGWSPKSAQGQRFELCAAKPRGRCIKPVRRLNGKNQVLNTRTVRRGDVYRGFLQVRLRVNGRGRAVDFVRSSRPPPIIGPGVVRMAEPRASSRPGSASANASSRRR
jgi:hypothetical protein